MRYAAVKFLQGGLLALLCMASVLHAAPSAAQFVREDKEQPASPLKLAAIDFLLPGYGTYVQNKIGFAAFYCAANIANLTLVYLAWRNWRFYESAYQAAVTRQASEPDKLYFQDPTGGDSYLSLQDIRNRAERGQLFFAISILANVVLRGVSAYHSWSLADEAATKSGPRYEFYPDGANGFKSQLGYQWSF